MAVASVPNSFTAYTKIVSSQVNANFAALVTYLNNAFNSSVVLNVANGGTGLASYTQGDLIYASAGTTLSKLAKDANATRYLSNTGATNNPAWAQIALATGVSGQLPIANGGTGAATKTAGFDALSPMTTSGDIIYGGASGTGTRLAKGSDTQVLTLVSGLPAWSNTGASTAPKQTVYLSGSGTFSKTGSPLYIRFRMVGGGGGGAGSGTSGAGNGTAGNQSTFGASTCAGGSGATASNSNGGAGGSATLGSGHTGIAVGGGGGGASAGISGASFGGTGGNSALGGGGLGATATGSPGGFAAATNTGAGGGGAGSNGTGTGGAGGGAGGYIDAIILSPSATYSYAVGASAAGGTAGVAGVAGGNGASGFIEVTEYYQ